MTSLCVIGDSHVGALKRGWSLMQSGGSNRSLVFFAAHVSKWKELVAHGQVLEAGGELARDLTRSSRGVHSIDTRLYDAFVIVALGFGIYPVLQTYAHFAYDKLPDVGHARYRISTSCFAAASHGRLAATAAVQVGEMIRAACGKPIFIVPMPLPGEQLAGEASASGYAPFVAAAGTPNIAELMRMYLELCGSLEQAMQVEVLQQPARTVVEGTLSTRARYSALDDEGAETDGPPRLNKIVHMNAEFGMLTLHEVFSRLGGGGT